VQRARSPGPPSGGGQALVAGVEAGGTKFVCAIGTGPDDVRAETLVATSTPAATIARALDFFTTHARTMPFAALGIASFGPLDLDPRSPTYGFITTTPKPGWAETDLVTAFRERLGVRVAIDTDVNGAVLAEHRWGAARDVATALYVTVGTGIGGGALVDARPVHGLAHPEMGHMRVPRAPTDGFAGVCPYHGDCLEGLASGPAIEARWGLAAAALPADHPAWPVEARYLALGLVNAIAVLSPERIVLGGGVMRAPGLLGRVRANVLELLGGYVPAPAVAREVDRYIVAPALGERAGTLGAIALAHAVA
jgi:fructokinase